MQSKCHHVAEGLSLERPVPSRCYRGGAGGRAPAELGLDAGPGPERCRLSPHVLGNAESEAGLRVWMQSVWSRTTPR